MPPILVTLPTGLSKKRRQSSHFLIEILLFSTMPCLTSLQDLIPKKSQILAYICFFAVAFLNIYSAYDIKEDAFFAEQVLRQKRGNLLVRALCKFVLIWVLDLGNGEAFRNRK